MARTADCEPVALHVEIGGEGPTIVLLHGFGGSARNFRRDARALRNTWRVVLADLRGHARSPAPEPAAAYRPECFEADVRALLDRLEVERAVLGGLSFGASVALRFALRHPERVHALVLAAYPAARDGGGIAAIAPRFAERIDRDGLEAAGAEFVWGPRSGFDAAAAAFVKQGFLEHPPHALAHILRESLARERPLGEMAPALARLEVPTLVVAGSLDRVSLGPCRELAAALPRAELVEIPDAGHVVNLAAPAAFQAALRRFLDALPPSAG